MSKDFIETVKGRLATVQAEIAARVREVNALNALIAIYDGLDDNQPGTPLAVSAEMFTVGEGIDAMPITDNGPIPGIDDPIKIDIFDAPRSSGYRDRWEQDGHRLRLITGEAGSAYELSCLCGWEGSRAGWQQHKADVIKNPEPDNQPQAEETAAAPIPEVVGTAEPEPDAGASSPVPAVGQHPGRPRDGYGDKEVAEVLRLNREGVDNIYIAARLKLTKGTVAGILFRHRNSTTISEPGDPVLTSTARALLDVIRKGYAAGTVPKWNELAQLSGVKKGSLSFVLESLTAKGLVIRDEHGLRPAGKPPLRQQEADTEAAATTVAPAATTEPKPKTEDELIAEHLATKGVVHVSDEWPTGQEVLDEARREHKVVANKELSLFRVGPGGGQRMWRDGLLTIANRQRIARGEKPWATTRVRWPNEDGTFPPPLIAQESA